MIKEICESILKPLPISLEKLAAFYYALSKLQSQFAALFNAKSAAAQQEQLCTRPNLPPQDLAVFNAKFDRRAAQKIKMQLRISYSYHK